MHTRIEEEKVKINICTVYNVEKKKGIEETFRKIEEKYEGEGIIIGGDFNIRIGELGGVEIGRQEMSRKSKDKIIDNGGKEFIEKIYDKDGIY